jgi:uncharacterized protein GlcG (DUF336 family)
MTLSLDQARSIVQGARAAGREHGLKPLTVVVLDAGGYVVAVEREDGSSNKRFEIAFGKAHGAVSLGMGSRALMARAEQQPYFIAAGHQAAGPLVPVPGGVLVQTPKVHLSEQWASPATPQTTTRSRPWPASSPPAWWVSRADEPPVPRVARTCRRRRWRTLVR